MPDTPHESATRRRRPISVYSAWLMCLLPALAWAEMSLRSPTAVPLVRNFILELFILLCMAPALFLFMYPPLVFVLAAGLAGWAFLLRKQIGFRRLFFRACWRVIKILTGISLAAFWWALVAVRVGLFTIIGLLAFGVWLALARRRPKLANNLWLVLGLFAFCIFMFDNAKLPDEFLYSTGNLIYPYAAYDVTALPDGNLVVMDAEWERAVWLRDEQAMRINQTYSPQRAAVDETTGEVYVANFAAHRDRTVTRLFGAETSFLPLPTCDKAIDVVLAAKRRRLFVVCEKSGSVHAYDLSRQREIWDKAVPLMPYAAAIDTTRWRLFVASELFSGKVTVLEPDSGRRLASRRLGWVNWDVAVDPSTGLAWVARPLVGEVVAIDGEGRVVQRLSVMGYPRDLAIDQERGLLLAGLYFSGAVSVVDLRKGEVLAVITVGENSAWSMLRGVEVAPDGSWLISQASGVWRVRPRFDEEGSFFRF